MSDAHIPKTLSTVDQTGHRIWVYPKAIKGRFTLSRQWVSYALMVFYFGVPWLKINGLPAFQLDVTDRRFIILGQIFFPQDVKYLVFVLVAAAIAMFFFTALAGRLWCGWACPQTVFLEFVFRKIEILIEGDRNQRLALDNAPWGLKKIGKKSFKHILFLIFASLTANTFLAYFVGIDNILKWITQPPSEHWGAFLFMMFNLVIFYFDFAWFREQFCTLLCPYARFQSALADENTFQVSYDEQRGEPRGKVGKANGDCVNCNLCVQVCPTGIDIRDGLQLECIGCARCIDACDSIMDKVKRPRGLIRYDSEARMEGKTNKIIRPRIMIYAGILLVMIAGLIWSVSHRPLVEFTVIRNPGEPYSVLAGNTVSNHLTLRLINKDRQDHQIMVRLEEPEEAQLIVPIQPYPLFQNSTQRLDIFVNVPQRLLENGKLPITLYLDSDGQQVGKMDIRLLGPQ
ncbi:MAG: cytochrome c oxidase accessory protein CcoG [SAR324 cluster bacterium]|nr:cytochrome c oxidase accessory protein CcoG [SAR324 cluster bacterium]